MIYPIMWKNHCKNSSILLGYSFFFTWVFLVYTTYVLIYVYTTYIFIQVVLDLVILHFGCLSISQLAAYIQHTWLYFLIWLFFTLAAFHSITGSIYATYMFIHVVLIFKVEHQINQNKKR